MTGIKIIGWTQITEDGPESILGEARTGDQEALVRLLEQYRDYLDLLARAQIDRLPSLKMTPSDLVEETMLEALRDFERFGDKTEREFAILLRGILVRRGLLATFDT